MPGLPAASSLSGFMALLRMPMIDTTAAINARLLCMVPDDSMPDHKMAQMEENALVLWTPEPAAAVRVKYEAAGAYCPRTFLIDEENRVESRVHVTEQGSSIPGESRVFCKNDAPAGADYGSGPAPREGPVHEDKVD